jgi:hypothetical protein
MSLSKKHIPLLTSFLMAFFMSLIMSFVLFLVNAGPSNFSLLPWLRSWLVAFPVAFFAISLVRPLVSAIVERLTRSV